MFRFGKKKQSKKTDGHCRAYNCTEHVKMYNPDIQKSDVGYKYCEQHSCANCKRIEKQKGPNHKFCTYCGCKEHDCVAEHSLTGKWCEEHTCVVAVCDEEISVNHLDLKCCDEHFCSTCHDVRHDAHRNCMCAVLGCGQYRERYNGFDITMTCNGHTCRMHNCYLPTEYDQPYNEYDQPYKYDDSYCKNHCHISKTTSEIIKTLTPLHFRKDMEDKVKQFLENGFPDDVPSSTPAPPQSSKIIDDDPSPSAPPPPDYKQAVGETNE